MMMEMIEKMLEHQRIANELYLEITKKYEDMIFDEIGIDVYVLIHSTNFKKPYMEVIDRRDCFNDKRNIKKIEEITDSIYSHCEDKYDYNSYYFYVGNIISELKGLKNSLDELETMMNDFVEFDRILNSIANRDAFLEWLNENRRRN